MSEIYLDNCATTKPYENVVTVAAEVMQENYGNPSSQYKLGRESKEIINHVRKTIAESMNAKTEEIYFTSGGTEGNNLAITGACLANKNKGNKIITSVAEHPAVTKTIRNLRRNGWEVAYIPIINNKLDLEKLAAEIDEQTVLVSIMYVNNEIGTIFPIKEIGEIIKSKNPGTLFHCDAVQAYGKISFDLEDLKVDLLTTSAHKIHGIKGSGALYVREGTKIFTTAFGGGQEKGLRSGTESTPLIAGFGAAIVETFDNFQVRNKHISNLKQYLLQELKEFTKDITINSPKTSSNNIVSFSIHNVSNDQSVEYFDKHGIAIGSGAACKSNYSRGPTMLESLGLTRNLAEGALRISFSYQNTTEEINFFIEKLRLFLNKKNKSLESER